MDRGKIFCLIVVLAFFNLKSAGLKLGSFINSTDKPVQVTISTLKDSIKSLPSSSQQKKFKIRKNSSIKLDEFSFETPEGPASGFFIVYSILGQRKPSKLSIKYKHYVIDDKNCSKCGLCPSGYMASVYKIDDLNEAKLYKNVYSPISQKGHGVLDLNLTSSGLQLTGKVQILDPEYLIKN